jgi:predicted nucleic acid-binding protein
VATLGSAFHLDLGESEAILVAEALGNAPVLMDERRGVRCARSRGIVVIRTPLIYADAKILGLIGSVQEKLDELRSHGFRLSTGHYEQILKDLGEL